MAPQFRADERPIPARPRRVKRAGDELLSRTGLACDQDETSLAPTRSTRSHIRFIAGLLPTRSPVDARSRDDSRSCFTST